MIFTLLQAITDTSKMMTGNQKSATPSPNNYWMWIAVAELAVIGYLTYRLLNNRKPALPETEATLFTEAKSSNIDMGDLMNNITKSRNLYKQLSAKCHPDRFAMDAGKRQIADEIFQELSRHQRNYSKLLALQERAGRELNIHL
ncbi:MAG: hypothetical protein EOO45_10490 [Flavobacterium sp.]|nr:MAG: hypothetical protein EOO45_10490 [Flavobacterium sp.]